MLGCRCRFVALLSLIVGGCGNASPPKAAERTVESKPPALAATACTDLAQKLARFARLDHDAVRQRFVAIAVSPAACEEASRSVHVLMTVAPDQSGLAVQKLFELTIAKHPETTAAQRSALAELSTTLVRQYLEIAADGSEDALPRGRGTSFYVAHPVRLHLGPGGLRLDLRDQRHEFPPDAPTSDAAAFERRLLELARDESPDREPYVALMLHATAQTKWNRVKPSLRAAKAAGYEAVGIAVRDGNALRQTTLEISSLDVSDAPTITLGDRTTAFEGRSVPERSALTAAVRGWHEAHAAASVVVVSPSAETSLEDIVSATEAAADCKLDEAIRGDAIPPPCLLWRAWLDLS